MKLHMTKETIFLPDILKGCGDCCCCCCFCGDKEEPAVVPVPVPGTCFTGVRFASSSGRNGGEEASLPLLSFR